MIRGSDWMVTVTATLTVGSPAVTVISTMRAIGVRPCAFSARSLTMSAALAPSQIWLAFAAEMTPPSLSSLTDPIPSRVASYRMPSSLVWGSPFTITGTISAVNAPASVAVAAL
jgi:hypothetical protein